MKRWFVAVVFLLTAGFGAFAQTVTLDTAIKTSAGEIGGRLEEGVKIAVLNFNTTSRTMADYVLAELSDALVNDGRLTVVDRRNLDLIRQELEFNDSGEVSNNSAQQIGRMLGAQMIVSGSLEQVSGAYRFRVQVLEVESAALKYSASRNVRDDRQVKILIAGASDAIDFTAGERAGAVGLNLVFGLGSFSQKDKVGGGITAALEGIGAVAAIIGLVYHGVGGEDYYTWDGIMGSGNDIKIHPPLNETYSAYPVYIGFGVYGVGAVYGIVRALTYHKPGAVALAESPPWNIAFVPDSRGNTAVRLSYTLRY